MGIGQRIRIFVDADACPVKPEIYKVAERHGIDVVVVANSAVFIPRETFIERVVVGSGSDAADDWIAERAGEGAIVVTADIPLADRCVAAGARVVTPSGRLLDRDAIGLARATRDLLTDLRSSGMTTSGPPPFTPRDRSAFLSALDLTIVRLKRGGRSA